MKTCTEIAVRGKKLFVRNVIIEWREQIRRPIFPTMASSDFVTCFRNLSSYRISSYWDVDTDVSIIYFTENLTQTAHYVSNFAKVVSIHWKN